jgi:hypothetical protein
VVKEGAESKESEGGRRMMSDHLEGEPSTPNFLCILIGPLRLCGCLGGFQLRDLGSCMRAPLGDGTQIGLIRLFGATLPGERGGVQAGGFALSG